MLIYIAPVSGGRFPSQLTYMCGLHKKPDLMLGASGGNVASYLAMASNFNFERAKKVVETINHGMFVSGSLIGAYFRGHFNEGRGTKELFEEIFTCKTIQEIEIITLITEENEEPLPRMFSNRTEESSLFYNCPIDQDIALFSTNGIEHLEGHLNDLSIICLASASIPNIAPPQKFNGNKYVDGGVTFPSPLSPLSCYLKAYVNHYNHKLQMVYFMPYDVANFGTIHRETYIDFRTAGKCVHYSILQDRAIAVAMLPGKPDFVQDIESNMELVRDKLEELKDKNYVMMIYPFGKDQELDLINFEGDDIVKAMEYNKNHLSYQLWYTC